jgi:hypothetical protein
MGVLLGMMRRIARSMKGERVYDIKPFSRGSRVTVVGAISQKKVIAMKTMLRRFIPQSVQTVEKLLELGVKLCSSKQIRNYFAHCCYCTS